MKNRILLQFLIATCIILILLSCNGRRQRDSAKKNRTEQRSNTNKYRGKTVVNMKKKDGVYFVPCKINGSEMLFVFDTGASDITMSLTEALFLYKQGKLTEDDFIGTQQYQIADGSIAEGTVINLQSVTIGNRTLRNVQASIVNNMEAPLLLGQSALSEFGKISIDYKKQIIIFE